MRNFIPGDQVTTDYSANFVKIGIMVVTKVLNWVDEDYYSLKANIIGGMGSGITAKADRFRCASGCNQVGGCSCAKTRTGD